MHFLQFGSEQDQTLHEANRRQKLWVESGEEGAVRRLSWEAEDPNHGDRQRKHGVGTYR